MQQRKKQREDEVITTRTSSCLFERAERERLAEQHRREEVERQKKEFEIQRQLHQQNQLELEQKLQMLREQMLQESKTVEIMRRNYKEQYLKYDSVNIEYTRVSMNKAKFEMESNNQKRIVEEKWKKN